MGEIIGIVSGQHHAKTGSNISVGEHTHGLGFSAFGGRLVQDYDTLYAASSPGGSPTEPFIAIEDSPLGLSSEHVFVINDIFLFGSGAHTHGHTATPDEKIKKVHAKSRITDLQYQEKSEGLVVSGVFNLDSGEMRPFSTLYPYDCFDADEKLKGEKALEKGIVVDLKIRWMQLNGQTKPPAKTIEDIRKVTWIDWADEA